MAEQPERTEPFTNEQPEHLTFAEAGERLGLSPDAVRMRVNRGKLAAVSVNGRTLVLWPQPQVIEHPNEPRTEPNRSPVQDDSRLIAALEAHIASLEHQLSERSEEIRRRDHIIAGFLERLPEVRELQPGAILDAEEPPRTHSAAGNGPEATPEAPQRGGAVDMVDMSPTASRAVPGAAEGTQGTRWRRWWRRVLGHEG